jgi:hypothetical protein
VPTANPDAPLVVNEPFIVPYKFELFPDEINNAAVVKEVEKLIVAPLL